MAQTILVSDPRGKELLGEEGQTVKFGFLGAGYEIGLPSRRRTSSPTFCRRGRMQPAVSVTAASREKAVVAPRPQ